ncbi:ATP-binding cassette domain-containing protein [Microbacterium sp. ASV49]|uniref:ATP-binding cassette domain-containing protein n=1 Tax=Microbacterium candidum TaxID=3041922 RepID=A0ABT7MVF2_9MICO|nr:ATP-binding cassette domain-containing protein [Microbacterium sp. ASV49]MDL9978426.1 ATP-binding cassette domain-containing protein [Microbacterium sp. ASV49]
MDSTILELRHITKAFGDKIANNDISLEIRPGRVHAIVGENGAGKTTLMNMISGNLQPTAGEIMFDGQSVILSDPTKADALGIGMVHQHFKLVPSLTVAANIFLGKEKANGFGKLDQRAMEQRVGELSETFGLKINPKDKVQDLSVGERQRVEIIKALSHDTRVLILDEPTAVLTPAETDEMFVVVRQLAERGCAVLFISHKLGEVLSIADVVTVIRDGEVVDTRPAQGLTQTDIATMMVGREVLLRIMHTPPDPQAEVLAVEGVYAVDQRGAIAVNNLSLSVRSGEIVGIAGVEGNGQSELAASIAGMYLPPRGRVTLGDQDVTSAPVAERRSKGLAYISEDRQDEGAGPTLTIAENIAATHLDPPIAKAGWLSVKAMRTYAQGLITKFDVRGARPDTPIGTLSGGNMQKVIIAREFESDPKLLMVSQPTRGVDVGAMEFVHNSIVKARDAGAGVLLFSADLNEVMSLSDRLLVMYRGQIIAEFTQETMSEVAVGLAMAGVVPTAEALAEAEAERERVAAELEATGATLAEGESAEVAQVAEVDAVDTTSILAPLDTEAVARATKETERTAVFADFATKALRGAVQPVVAVLVALAIGAVIILLIGQNPITAYVQLFASGWSTPYGIGTIIAMFIPLSIMSAGTIISFRAGFFSIAGEGSLYFGAFFGAWVGFTFHGLPPIVGIALILIVGTIAGALWSLIPGALYAFWRVDIVVTTLLLSTVAMLITNFFVTGPFQDKTAGAAASPKIDEAYNLNMFNPEYGIGPDLILALIVAVLLGLVLMRTPWGLKVKQLGEMNRFAEYTGVSVKSMSMQVLMVSGAAAGIAGALYIIGPNGGRFLQAFSPGFGFLAITVALLARLNPWASLVAALFYATMMAGTTGLQTAGVPFPIVNVLQGLIIITITATFIFNRKRGKRRQPTEPVQLDKAEMNKGVAQ